jgi:hypothetical protein
MSTARAWPARCPLSGRRQRERESERARDTRRGAATRVQEEEMVCHTWFPLPLSLLPPPPTPEQVWLTRKIEAATRVPWLVCAQKKGGCTPMRSGRGAGRMRAGVRWSPRVRFVRLPVALRQASRSAVRGRNPAAAAAARWAHRMHARRRKAEQERGKRGNGKQTDEFSGRSPLGVKAPRTARICRPLEMVRTR